MSPKPVMPTIIDSITRLGYDIRDVKVLVNSHAHFDHAGGLAELQRASGAELWVSAADAEVMAAGGRGDHSLARRSSMAALRIAFCSFSKARTSI